MAKPRGRLSPGVLLLLALPFLGLVPVSVVIAGSLFFVAAEAHRRMPPPTPTLPPTLAPTATTTPNFTPPPLLCFNLSVNLVDAGTVKKTPSPDCPDDSAKYQAGTKITLTASPAPGYTFQSWSGHCMGTHTCNVTMTTNRSVTATFTQPQYSLSVDKVGTGSGTVTSSPAGINCGADCSELYNLGTIITLTASPAAGSIFARWSAGGCTGTGTCTVTTKTTDAATSVTAIFSLIPTATHTLTVLCTGQGSVSPQGCGTTFIYKSGSKVTLTAAPFSGYQFAEWSGACDGALECVLIMNEPKTVTAIFSPIPTATPSPTASPIIFTLIVN